MRLYRFLKSIIVPVMSFLMPFKVFGKERIIKEGGGLYICNHYRKMDIIYIASLEKQPIHFIAKAELLKTKIGKWFFTKLGVIPVNRDSTDVGALMQGLRYLKQGKKLSLFPEGTRNRSDSDLLEIKGGAGLFAVKAQKPLQPVMQYRQAKFFRRNYLMVGEPFELSEFYNKKLTSSDFDQINIRLRDELLKVKQELILHLKNKGIIKQNADNNS